MNEFAEILFHALLSTSFVFIMILLIEYINVQTHGNWQQNMCDGCPDITVWNGKLVWSCRMEEQLKFG
jgi:hypothetical protein